MVGCYLAIFIKKKHLNRITYNEIEMASVKCGFAN